MTLRNCPHKDWPIQSPGHFNKVRTFQIDKLAKQVIFLWTLDFFDCQTINLQISPMRWNGPFSDTFPGHLKPYREWSLVGYSSDDQDYILVRRTNQALFREKYTGKSVDRRR